MNRGWRQVFLIFNKKVLLRERKRHTARRVAIAISCYSGGGGSLTKNFFLSLNMYQAKSDVKNFSLYWEGGSLDKKFVSQSEHVSSQIWCQKFFPLLGGGGSLDKNFFSQSEHVSSQIWCQKFFPLLGGNPRQKNFSPVWTCIEPNLVSKIFPFTETGYPPWKSETGYPPKIWDWVPPPKSETGYPPENLRPGTPPKIWDRGPPPPGPGPGTPPEQTHTCENITSRRTYVRGR